jgi:hypothetical protein
MVDLVSMIVGAVGWESIRATALAMLQSGLCSCWSYRLLIVYTPNATVEQQERTVNDRESLIDSLHRARQIDLPADNVCEAMQNACVNHVTVAVSLFALIAAVTVGTFVGSALLIRGDIPTTWAVSVARGGWPWAVWVTRVTVVTIGIHHAIVVSRHAFPCDHAELNVGLYTPFLAMVRIFALQWCLAVPPTHATPMPPPTIPQYPAEYLTWLAQVAPQLLLGSPAAPNSPQQPSSALTH